MKPSTFIVLAILIATGSGCTSTVSRPIATRETDSNLPPQTTALAALQKEFSDILTPPPLTAAVFPEFRFKVVNATTANEEDPHSILTMLRAAKAAGKEFSVISSIEFISPSEALVLFLWSGGFHGGSFTLEKIDSKWEIVSQGYAY